MLNHMDLEKLANLQELEDSLPSMRYENDLIEYRSFLKSLYDKDNILIFSIFRSVINFNLIDFAYYLKYRFL